MKQYTIDDIRLQDRQTLKAYLDRHLETNRFPDLYRLPLHGDLLGPIQAAHIECQPHYFALELEENRLVCELLVRTDQRIRCDCMGYADDRQCLWLMHKIDAIFRQLEIIV